MEIRFMMVVNVEENQIVRLFTARATQRNAFEIDRAMLKKSTELSQLYPYPQYDIVSGSGKDFASIRYALPYLKGWNISAESLL